MVRVPSRLDTTAEPEAPSGRSARNISEGLVTSSSPPSFISKTPISITEPNLFLTARSILKGCPLSPSKYRTVSTMCSRTFGPAIAPSFVTWPTRKSGTSAPLAYVMSRAETSLTCPTLPGDDSNASE